MSTSKDWTFHLLKSLYRLRLKFSRENSSRTTTRGIVAAAGLTTASDRNTTESKVRAAVTAAENIVVSGVVRGRASHINEGNAGDSNAVGRVSSWTTIEVVLLDVNAVVRDSRDGDVLVRDVADLYTA